MTDEQQWIRGTMLLYKISNDSAKARYDEMIKKRELKKVITNPERKKK